MIITVNNAIVLLYNIKSNIILKTMGLFQIIEFNGLEVLLFSVMIVLAVIIAILLRNRKKQENYENGAMDVYNAQSTENNNERIILEENRLIKVYEHAVYLFNNKNYSASLLLFQDLERYGFNAFNKRSMVYYFMGLSLEKLGFDWKKVKQCFENAKITAQIDQQNDVMPIIQKEEERINRIHRIK